MSATPPNIFAGLSLILDRMAERRDDAAWLAAQAEAPTARYLLLDATSRAFLHADRDALRWLDAAEHQRLCADVTPYLLGIAGDRPYFLLTLENDIHADALATELHARRAGLRETGLLLAADEAALFAYAKGLAHWHRETRHCAYCGSPLLVVSAGHRLHCTNAACGRMHFPRTDAAIIVIVEHEGACLLGRQSGWPPGRYSTLAGFIEPGEALEDAVRREVLEESGVRVGAVHYHSSQPWPMPASLMVGFTAVALDPTIRLRDGELEEARWFTPQQIADGIADGSFIPSPPLSVSYRLLQHWLRERAGMELDALAAARAAM
ncbi:NAD(+) diphosphatase [Rhodanobacter sp. DHG33]|uniref:NAD(+) diphosphatase n=1 Tax=Rhodanobacter sp. DHG33 TaxID=2775921 RepID=UPI0017870B50|nr:NAD(+) diphosphatase [Rhodanobacter sp. DHG33]MBD8898697.1 NAD(+) diphosphatase [Rhodanobacter sp. DHG33]